MARNAIEHSFQTETDKALLLKEFEQVERSYYES